MSDYQSSDMVRSSTAAQTRPPSIFVNYRHEDSRAEAGRLYDRLAARYGKESVYLDVNLPPGLNWRQAIETQGASCQVFIAVIGPRWHAIMTDRAGASFVAPVEDHVKREIEQALSRGSGVVLVPVLLDTAMMPDVESLPRSMKALTSFQAARLRTDYFDHDVERLLERLDQASNQQAARDARRAEPLAAVQGAALAVSRSGLPAAHAAPPPDARHYERVLRYLVDEGTLVILLGSHVNACDGDWILRSATRRPLDADELALGLADRSHLDTESDDLPSIAQQVYVSLGRTDLYRILTQLLPREPEPGVLHRFLARLPAELEYLGRPRRNQLIVTTNYDAALERAFDEENEPYDLVVYMASGKHKGKFLHIPFDDDPRVISVPNRYDRFLIGEDGELKDRSVILKVHGAVDGGSGDYLWTENYVVTEDQYIEYLSRSPIESLIPVQLLDKLTGSHWLFLGYTMRDWNLRVFLNRVSRGERLGARSWAIEENPDALEKDFWTELGVELFSSPLVEYVAALVDCLKAQGRLDV